MLKLETRPQPSSLMSVASPLIALGLTVIIGVILFLLLGKDGRKSWRSCRVTRSGCCLP